MTLLALIFLSTGLAMDATAVSLACSISHPSAKKMLLFKAAIYFGLFQGLMPLLGFALGLGLKGYIQGFDHWVAFILLAVVGIRMMFEKTEEGSASMFGNKKLAILAIATSIDALIVGITLSFTKTNLLLDIAAIGLITFILSLSAGFLGKLLASFKIQFLHIAGGLAIVVVGLKILLDHLLT